MITKRLFLAACALALLVVTGCGRHRCGSCSNSSSSFSPPCCPSATSPPPGLPPAITP